MMESLQTYIFIKRYPFSLLVGEFSHCVVDNINQKSKYTQNDNVKASYQMALPRDFDQFKIQIDLSNECWPCAVASQFTSKLVTWIEKFSMSSIKNPLCFQVSGISFITTVEFDCILAFWNCIWNLTRHHEFLFFVTISRWWPICTCIKFTLIEPWVI